MPETAKCKHCGYEGDAGTFKPCMTPYHDLRCPVCNTTAVDTSALNAAWKARGEEYGYGDNNTMTFD